MTDQANYLQLVDTAKTHVCAQHPDLCLTLAWDKKRGYILRCSAGHEATKLQRLLSLTEQHKQGLPLPVYIENKIERKEAKMEQAKLGQEKKIERLPVVYEASTGEVVAAELRKAVIEWAAEVGLNPRLGHVCLYHGKPWVTIDGWYYRLRKRYPEALIVTAPIVGEERKQLMVDDQTHAWKALVYECQAGKQLSVGYGFAREGEEPLARKSAVEPTWPWRMAEKRAEEDAIRKVVPLEIEKEVDK